MQPNEFYECIISEPNRANLKAGLEKQLHSLELKRSKSLDSRTRLEANRVAGEFDDENGMEAYCRVKTLLETQSRWIAERVEAINEQLAQLGREDEAVSSFIELREHFWSRLYELSNDEWRELFAVLNFEIHVKQVELTKFVKAHLPTMIWECTEFNYSLPLKESNRRIGDIVLNKVG